MFLYPRDGRAAPPGTVQVGTYLVVGFGVSWLPNRVAMSSRQPADGEHAVRPWLGGMPSAEKLPGLNRHG